jgi:hypothetical protein
MNCCEYSTRSLSWSGARVGYGLTFQILGVAGKARQGQTLWLIWPSQVNKMKRLIYCLPLFRLKLF